MDDYLVGLDVNKLADMKFYPLLKNEVKLPKYKEQIKQLVTDNTSNFSIETKLLCRLKELVEMIDRLISLSILTIVKFTICSTHCRKMKNYILMC